MAQPEEARGLSTQACYMTVADVEAHRARAQAAGAKIEIASQDDGSGGRFYSCRDCGGHLWSFGSRDYTPASKWEPPAPAAKTRSRQQGALLSSLSALAVLAVLGWVLYETTQPAISISIGALSAQEAQARHREVREVLAGHRVLRSALEHSVSEADARLERELALGAELRKQLQRAQAKAAELERAKAAAERALEASRADVAKHLQAFQRAEARAADTQAKLARAESELRTGAGALRDARTAGETAERARAEAAAGLAAEREQREAAQEQREELRARLAQLEDGIIAERMLRTRAEQELAAVRAQLAELRRSASPSQLDSHQVTAALSEAKPGASPEPKTVAKDPEPETQDDAGKSAASASGNGRQSPRSSASVCRAAALVSGRPSGWNTASLTRLCKGAYNSAEPAKCFHHLMRGKVNWGGGTEWVVDNALDLCGGTLSASQTVDCFVKNVAAGMTWRTAIRRCKTG